MRNLLFFFSAAVSRNSISLRCRLGEMKQRAQKTEREDFFPTDEETPTLRCAARDSRPKLGSTHIKSMKDHRRHPHRWRRRRAPPSWDQNPPTWKKQNPKPNATPPNEHQVKVPMDPRTNDASASEREVAMDRTSPPPPLTDKPTRQRQLHPANPSQLAWN